MKNRNGWELKDDFVIGLLALILFAVLIPAPAGPIKRFFREVVFTPVGIAGSAITVWVMLMFYWTV